MQRFSISKSVTLGEPARKNTNFAGLVNSRRAAGGGVSRTIREWKRRSALGLRQGTSKPGQNAPTGSPALRNAQRADGEREGGAVIRQYLREAMSRARINKMQDGSYSGVVPGLRGVIATGATPRACRSALEEVVEEWILVRVARGLKVPTLGNARIAVRGRD